MNPTRATLPRGIHMMAKTGLVLNFMGVVLVTLLVYFLAAAAFGIVL